MSIILVAVLIIGGLVGTVAVVVAIPVLFGLATFDVLGARKRDSHLASAAPKTVSLERISLERGIARAFVIVGGAFWAVAIFAGMYSFRQDGMAFAMLGAFFPLVAVAATLAIGWYFERAASALLVLASFAVVAWGVIYQFELGVWAVMTLALIGPMMTAAMLFWMARRDQEAFELALSTMPVLAPMSARDR
ncbi:MAG: hypothetical protein WCJ13_03675 [Coriobacteriia bacterium]